MNVPDEIMQKACDRWALLLREQSFDARDNLRVVLGELLIELRQAPIPMLLCCADCGARHIDRGEFATKVHHTHACQECGNVWRPAVVPTVGVQFLPGFKDDTPGPSDVVAEVLIDMRAESSTGRHWADKLEAALAAQKAGAR